MDDWQIVARTTCHNKIYCILPSKARNCINPQKYATIAVTFSVTIYELQQ